MNKILSLTRRCVEDYNMIAPGDRIAVGVSGGKDSLMLLAALAKLRQFYPVPFTVEAITLDMGRLSSSSPLAVSIKTGVRIPDSLAFRTISKPSIRGSITSSTAIS